MVTDSQIDAALAERPAPTGQQADPIARAISVLGDVLNDIADWEDKALAEAVTEARNGLLTIAGGGA